MKATAELEFACMKCMIRCAHKLAEEHNLKYTRLGSVLTVSGPAAATSALILHQWGMRMQSGGVWKYREEDSCFGTED